MRVALFATCLGDQFFAEACADTVRLLRHVGVEVEVPEGQTCCGQPAYNSGRPDEARRMAKHMHEVLDAHEYVVLPSGKQFVAMPRVFTHRLASSRTHQ